MWKQIYYLIFIKSIHYFKLLFTRSIISFVISISILPIKIWFFGRTILIEFFFIYSCIIGLTLAKKSSISLFFLDSKAFSNSFFFDLKFLSSSLNRFISFSKFSFEEMFFDTSIDFFFFLIELQFCLIHQNFFYLIHQV